MRLPASGDSGDIVLGWLVRLVGCLAVAGVLVFDGISVGVAELEVTDLAATASRAASAELAAFGSNQDAYDAAWRSAVADEPSVELPVAGFGVGPDRAVTVTVQRTVHTLVLHHVPRSESWLTVTASSTRGPG